MKSGRFGSILTKLVVSYVLITIFVAALIGTASISYFSDAYNEKSLGSIENALEHTQKSIETEIFNKVDSIYVYLTAENFKSIKQLEFFEAKAVDNYTSVYDIQMYLKEILSQNYDLIHGISIYYKNIDVTISADGITYADDIDSSHPDWVKYIKDNDDKNSNIATYVATRQIGNNSSTKPVNVFTIMKPYPYNASPEKIKGYIVFDINEAVVRNILEKSLGEYSDDVVLVDKAGNVISKSNLPEYPLSVAGDSYIDEILKSEKKSDSFNSKIDGKPYLVSYISLNKNDWKIVARVTNQVFYSAMHSIRNLIWVICLLAIFAGFAVAALFTRHIYSPLDNIVNRLKSQSDIDYNSNNEYYMINESIEKLLQKVDKFEATIKENRSLIKYDALTRLIYNKIGSETEIDELLEMINKSFSGNCYNTVELIMDKNIISKLDVSKRKILYYEIIKEIENKSNAEHSFMAIEIVDFKIVVLVNSIEEDTEAVRRTMKAICDYIYSDFSLNAFCFIGTWTYHVLDIHTSFETAEKCVGYQFVFPAKNILDAEFLEKREANNEPVPNRFFEQFDKSLKSNDIQAIKKTIQGFVTELQSNNYSMTRCDVAIMSFLSLFSNHMKSLNIESADLHGIDIISGFKKIDNIIQFQSWLIELAEAMTEKVNMKNSERNKQNIIKIQEYIKNNINEDLSLNTIAEKIYISPAYLSKIFKDEVGINYSEYVTTIKLERAKELLDENNLNIEQIAEYVGYKTVHYFIKKFKERYGVTPNNYRLNKIKI